MWHYVFILVTTILCLCLLIIGSSKRANLISTSVEFNFINAREFMKQDNFSGILESDERDVKSAKRKIHIPKFMLDLYEERKREDYARNFSKPDIVRSVIPKNTEILHHLVIDRPRRTLEQFADGRKMLDVLSLIKKYPEETSALFCNKEETQLTANYLNRLFSIKRSPDGTQRRLLESKTTAFWRDYLQNCEGMLSTSDILQSFEENHMLIFDVPSSNSDETFFDAELRILTLVNVDANAVIGVERSITVTIYNESEKLDLLHQQHVYHSENTWITFNMTTPVKRLLTKCSKHKFLKLVITVKAFLPFLDYNKDHFKLSLLPVSEGMEFDYPILLLSYMTLKENIHVIKEFVKRDKRNAEEDYEEETNKIWDNDQHNKPQTKKMKRLKNTCKRKQLYVDFAEIQYDSWIVQPSGYEAYQCTGKCFYPVAQHLSPTKHAIVQALLHSVSPSRAPRSCCVPSKLESISLLYVDDKGVLTYRYGYNDMVVAECGCR